MYAKSIDNIYRTSPSPTQGGLTKTTRSTGTYGKLSPLGECVRRNLGRRGLTLAMKLEKKRFIAPVMKNLLAPVSIFYFLISK